jgi:hypothetical protein
MSSYLNENIKNSISNSLLRMHDTFARKIYIFKNAEKTIISTSANYNPIYGKTNAGSRGNVNYKMVKEEHFARVYYDKEDQEYLGGDSAESKSSSQNKIILSKGSIKIVVKIDGYRSLQEARRVEVDGRIFVIKSGGSHSGFPANEFYSFYLTPIDE